MKKIIFLFPVLMMIGCSHKSTQTASEPQPAPEVVQIVKPTGSRPLTTILKATAFKMSGNYSDNVAVTLNPDGSLAYYPAPSDITENSRPLDLGNGWWLNRQGLSPKSVFTKYTFEEYQNMKTTPSQDAIKAAIIPGAFVTDFKNLSYPAGQALEYLPQIKEELE